MKTAKEILYERLVIDSDGFHDDDSYKEQMSGGYEEQIVEAMERYHEQKLNLSGIVRPEGACPVCEARQSSDDAYEEMLKDEAAAQEGEPLPAEGEGKAGALAKCYCGSSDLIIRHGIEQCADCGYPV